MRSIAFISFVCISTITTAQTDTTKWLRAFPITDYIVDINDSTKLVQVELPENFSLADKQIGVLYGVYNNAATEAVEKGYGRCNLIKGQYYYFTISHNKSGIAPQKGDLLYTMLPKTSAYTGQLVLIANHFICLLNVYDQPLYDRYLILNK